MKSAPFINNFSAGEFGPLASARTDLDRFGASQELCQNYVPRVQGGAVRRDGTNYVATTKASGVARLEKFIFSNEQAYVLEFGNLYIRFYTDGAQIVDGTPVEVTTTYTEADLFELSFCQSNDVLYIFHKDYGPQKLIRYSDIAWSFSSTLNFTGPYLSYAFSNENINFKSNNTLNTSAASGTTTLSFSHINRSISNATAHTTGEIILTIVGTVSLFFRNGDRVLVAGVGGTTEANGNWFVEVFGTGIILKGSVFVNAYVGGSDFVYRAPFYSTDVGKYIRIYDTSGTPDKWVYMKITVYNSSISVDAEILENTFATSPASLATWELGLYNETVGFPSSGCFHEDRLFLAGPNQYVAASRTGDYENFIRADDDGTVVDSHGLLFSLNSNDVNNLKWINSDEKGILAGTNANEWLIKSASTNSAITPTSVTAKKTTSFGSPQTQPVQAGKATIFLQASGRKIREFNYFYDVDGFRANDVTQLAHHICSTGIKQMSLSKQPEQIVWCVRNDGQLVGMTYERDLDGLRVAWHRHIIGGEFQTGIAEVESVACIPTSDNSYDEVWMVVKRTINDATVRFVEYTGQPFSEDIEQDNGTFVDSRLAYESTAFEISDIDLSNVPLPITTTLVHGFSDGDYVKFYDILGTEELNGNIYKIKNAAADGFELTDFDDVDIDGTDFGLYLSGGIVRKLVTAISGLDHLEGETVQACGDGADLGDYTVSAGAITLTDRSAIVHIGLGYQSKIKLPRIDAGSQDGTSFGKTRRIHRLAVMLYRSLGLKYGQNFDDMKSYEFSDGDDQMNQAPLLFSGIKTIEADFEYDTENNICLMQDRPLPSTILAVMPLMQTQDR